MNKVRKYGWNLLSILCTAIIISMVVSKLLTGWSSVFSYRVFYIMSESMEPIIHENQLVLGRVLSEDEELIIGKIYAYEKSSVFGKEIIIHRLISVDNKGNYIFKGDNNALQDKKSVSKDDIGYCILK